MANGIRWSVLHLGQLADLDTNETNSVMENPNALVRTWGSAAAPLFWTATTMTSNSDEDTRVELDHHPENIADTVSYNIGAGTVTTQLDSGAAVSGVITFSDGTTYSGTFALLQDRTGNVFMTIGDTSTVLASKAIRSLQVTAVVSHDYGYVEQLTRDDLQFVCFAPGTQIAVPGGTRSVESLAAGDLVETLDHGPQPVCWHGMRRVRLRPTDMADRPVIFAPGCRGGGPARVLRVSPQHRVLLRCGAEEGLAPAKFLLGQPGVTSDLQAREVTWHTLLFARHEVILAEGLAVETLLPGPVVMRLLHRTERAAMLRAVPALAEGSLPGGPARRVLKRREARAWLDGIPA